MVFLDFVKNRPSETQEFAPEQALQTQQPRTSREMYAAQHAQEKTNRQPASPEVKAQADRAMETLNESSFHIRPQCWSASPSEVGHSEPMRRNAVNQDKIAPALSRATEEAGRVADRTQSAPYNEPRQSGLHKRSTRDETIASERTPSTSPETDTGKEQTSPQRTSHKERSGWER